MRHVPHTPRIVSVCVWVPVAVVVLQCGLRVAGRCPCAHHWRRRKNAMLRRHNMKQSLIRIHQSSRRSKRSDKL
ncbi:hypothetical protein E2C01_007749 [Portunus trituberculatus]|uniref:Uncharacterized protein n=1 Tax=Portunus trituberculatus TaxID=210409 RepID=A0A5B7D013_PORTR|nr:hypothetical protein [Portunus trituberculatus]